jgi:two-component system nitrogen regulation response regulator GlnG
MLTVKLDATSSVLPKVLIVDDLEDVRWVLSNLIRLAGFTPIEAASGEEALARIRQEAPEVILLDVGLPDMDGFEVLTGIKAHDKTIPVIMVTAHGKTHDAVRAIRAGAYDYLSKPFSNEDIVLTVRRGIEEKAWKGRVRQSPPGTDALLDFMGKGAAIQRLQREVAQVTATNFSVLVTGETGTGKELVAQALHAGSARAAKPFVAVDCGAIAESLIESELFGHEKGAFTGAYQAQAGAFELASGGTIFLDEIGNMPLAMQGKLLRVLETRKIHRIGSTREREVDFRVVAATNADLRALAEQQRFRPDLYHRLAEFTIHLAPLRERTEDLPFLVNRFLAEASKELGKQMGGLSDSAWGLFQRYDWPGNVRELRNQLRQAVLLCDDPGEMISPKNLGALDARRSPSEGLGPDPAEPGDAFRAWPLHLSAVTLTYENNIPLKKLIQRVTDQVERALLLQALKLSEGNKAHAARLLQIDYKTIHSKLKAYEICSTPFMKDRYKTVERSTAARHYLGANDMTDKNRTEAFAEGKLRIEEIGRRLGSLFGQPKPEPSGSGGLFAGLGSLIEQLGKLAEQAERAGGVVSKTGDFNVGSDKRLKGVYGFSVKSALGEQGGVKIEPFGNIRRDEEGKLVEVQQIREPMVDLFDESDHVLIIAEVPGIEQEDVRLELQDDILIFVAEKGDSKYRKELLLPASFSSAQMSFTCRNGILEIRLNKDNSKD